VSDTAATDVKAQLVRAATALREMRARLEQVESARREPIAIVGMGCRFPGAATPDEYWAVLRDGVDAITETPIERWDAEALFDADPEAAGRVAIRVGGFVEGIDRFDATYFGIAPREAALMDPQQRLLLEVAIEAFEDGGQPTDRLAGTRTATARTTTCSRRVIHAASISTAARARRTASSAAGCHTFSTCAGRVWPSTPRAPRRSSPPISPYRACAGASASSRSSRASTCCSTRRPRSWRLACG
jgi:Beta-ketoacyl synthase, N-terminal domain